MDKRYLTVTIGLIVLGVALLAAIGSYLTSAAYLSSFMAYSMYAVIIAVILWVRFDAAKRYPEGGYEPILWGLVVLFLNVVGLVLYVLLRPKQIGSGG
ncbi:MAG: PLDc N-terminal domain-containing protein [Archaeoglobaceae archaeon]